VLLLDLGDTTAGEAELAAITADFYSKAFLYMRYDALGMGEWEARLIKDSGRAKLYGDSAPMICANVVDSSRGKLLASKPYVVKETLFGLKVGIIAVVGDDLLDAEVQRRLQIRINPPAEALRKYIGDLRKKSDLVILLSHTQPETARVLASEIPGIDVVLGSHISTAASEAPERIGNAVLMHTKPRGQYVGELVLDIGADRKIASFTGEHAALDTEIEDDPEITKLLAEHDKALADYRSRMRAPQRRLSPYGQRGPRPFVSSSKCRECHAKEYDSWSKTGHARASTSLKRDNRTGDLECLSCHTTAFNSVGGFRSAMETPQLGDVQCEACHGPGVTHARKPGKGYGKVLQSSCAQCHDPAKSPDFKFKAYKSRIAHSKGETGSQPAATEKD